MSPNGNALDFASATTFSSQVNGSLITHYQDLIYRVDTSATLYDSTKLAVTPNLYDKDTLTKTISGGTITYTGSVKWTRTLWNGIAFATSKEVQFYSASTPTASLTVSSPITSKSNLFTTVYTQAESVAVESYQYFLYDSSSVLIDQSDVIYSQKLTYTFTGFLDASTYYVRCVITNIYGQIVDTGLIIFTVDYVQPNVYFTPEIGLNQDTSGVTLDLANIVQITGTSSGTILYIDPYLIANNAGLNIADGSSYVEFVVDIPSTFTQTVIFNPVGFMSGVIISYDDGIFDVGYDGARFYFSYYVAATQQFVYGIPLALNSTPYIIGVENDRVIICQNNIVLDTVLAF